MDQEQQGDPPGGANPETQPADPTARPCLSDLRKATTARIVLCEENHIHFELREGGDNTDPNDMGRPFAEFVVTTPETAYTMLSVMQTRFREMLTALGRDAPFMQ
jgi:hypothetical protein